MLLSSMPEIYTTLFRRTLEFVEGVIRVLCRMIRASQ